MAEDNEANQALIARMLQNGGHRVTLASNGQEALAELCLSQYDLCIIDIQMPVLNGLETIKLFKQRNPQNNLPFIILTADESSAALEKCSQLGAVHLSKPVRSEFLLKTVKNVIENTQDQPAVSEKKIIDISKFDYFSDQKFLDEFIVLFEESCDKLTLNLRQSCVEDFEGFKKAVHTIKGLSGNINAESLRAVTVEAEKLSQETYNKKAEEYFLKITNELSRARNELLVLSSAKIDN